MSCSPSHVGQLGGFHVTELARRADVTPATIRYYSRVGLLDPVRNGDNGYRCFSRADLRRLVFIRQAQLLGLTIGDIKSVLETRTNGEVQCSQVESLVKQHRAGIRDRIADLQATETLITRALGFWAQMGDSPPVDDELCPLIERLDAVFLCADNVSHLPA